MNIILSKLSFRFLNMSRCKDIALDFFFFQSECGPQMCIFFFYYMYILLISLVFKNYGLYFFTSVIWKVILSSAIYIS